MAAVSRAIVCQEGDNQMTDETKNALPPVVNQPRRPPVRVKLRRVRANFAKVYPPDGESKAWWKRLKKALGTASSDFVNASLLQLQEASQLPFSGISEVAMNAARSLVRQRKLATASELAATCPGRYQASRGSAPRIRLCPRSK
jgi:hypothetical protein